MKEAIKKILDRNGYRVTLDNVSNGCMVTYPKRVESPYVQKLSVLYQYTESGLNATLYGEDNNELSKTAYSCPIYTQRLFIFYSTIRNCHLQQYPYFFACYRNNGKEVDEDTFVNLLESKYMTEDDIEKENILKCIVFQCTIIGFVEEQAKAAKESGVLDGYLLAKKILTIQEDNPNEGEETEDSVDGGGNIS